MDLWLDAMDFSRIHTLQLNYTDGRYILTEQVAQKLPNRVTSLSSLAVHHFIAESFILALPNNTLNHFRVPPTLSLNDLDQIAKLAPGLRNLKVDLSRQLNGSKETLDWSWEKLRLLAEKLPQLTDLTVYFGLGSECHRPSARQGGWSENGCVGLDRYAKPLLTETVAADMARFLSQHKAGQRLKSV
ncbi:hypothetical protein C8A03DRAFT_35378 [Achaetomium macrosporum]|uniref:Uncharacterized protein n=1 Tax=Achaetomium macrosporum TaxID=79813 RepID=A0AAN7HE20_9PEZI|nr:hypothetical protein C8A03DRAFT_35378 [Achaetomium macrosporum]